MIIITNYHLCSKCHSWFIMLNITIDVCCLKDAFFKCFINLSYNNWKFQVLCLTYILIPTLGLHDWWIIMKNFTFRPARLLCKFINEVASSWISPASMNLLANLMPYFTSALHPPHVQPLRAYRPFFLDLSHPQFFNLPKLQACVIEYATPADVTALAYAASGLAAI